MCSECQDGEISSRLLISAPVFSPVLYPTAYHTCHSESVTLPPLRGRMVPSLTAAPLYLFWAVSFPIAHLLSSTPPLTPHPLELHCKSSFIDELPPVLFTALCLPFPFKLVYSSFNRIQETREDKIICSVCNLNLAPVAI